MWSARRQDMQSQRRACLHLPPRMRTSGRTPRHRRTRPPSQVGVEEEAVAEAVPTKGVVEDILEWVLVVAILHTGFNCTLCTARCNFLLPLLLYYCLQS